MITQQKVNHMNQTGSKVTMNLMPIASCPPTPHPGDNRS
jgi:hypothetical protein